MRVNLLRAHGSPTDYLYKTKHGSCRCASCRAAHSSGQAAYRLEQGECLLARKRAYYAENREERKAYNRAHRDHIAAYSAAYEDSRRGTRAAYYKAHDAVYRGAHREQIAARMALYAATHRAEQLERERRWCAEHPEQRRANQRNRKARKRNASGAHTASDVAAQYLRQHGRCYWCGCKVGKQYHVDHVIPLSKGGSNGTENIVVACPACNLAKGAKMPHEFAERMC